MNNVPSLPAAFEESLVAPLDILKGWVTARLDMGRGFFERRRKGPPSSRAWSEMLDYYAGLYQDHGPDPERFRRLLRRCGVPQCRNPFPEGEAQHFLYHPDLLVMADLEAVLNDLVLTWNDEDRARKQKRSAPVSVAPEAPPADPDEWPDLSQAMRLRDLEVARQTREWSRLAGVCWGLVLLDGQSLQPLMALVPKVNLGWAAVHAFRTAPWAEWGLVPEEVLKAAQGHGILPAEIIQHLLGNSQADIALA